MSNKTTQDDLIDQIIYHLMGHLGRLPTEDEVCDFIQGTPEDRVRIWNAGIVTA